MMDPDRKRGFSSAWSAPAPERTAAFTLLRWPKDRQIDGVKVGNGAQAVWKRAEIAVLADSALAHAVLES